MTWEQLNLRLNNAYMVAANDVAQHKNCGKLWTFLTEPIKADFIKEVISEIEVNISFIIPYSSENSMPKFETKRKKQKRDHPGQISRGELSKIKETIRRGKI